MTTITRTATPQRPESVSNLSQRQARKRFLLLRLANQTYGIPVDDVREIVPMCRLSATLGLPVLLAGFLNLRGTAIPVLRLDRMFGLADLAFGLYTPLVVLGAPNHQLALVVDAVDRIVSVEEHSIVPVRENNSFNDCTVGMVTVDDHVILLLSPERLLLEKESQCLAELQDREQTRLHDLEPSKL